MKYYKSITLIFFTLTFLSCNTRKEYHVTEKYEIQTKSGKEYFLEVTLPVTYGYQVIDSFEVNGVDDYSIDSKDEFQTFNSKITGNGDVITTSIEYNVLINKKISYWESSLDDNFLLPTKYIDSDHQSIAKLAQSLKSDDEYKTAKNISEYVSRNIAWNKEIKINSNLRKASEILECKNGVCRDFSVLSVALLRASGIPSKSISGLSLRYLKRENPWDSSGISHAWVEFYVNGSWHFDDPSWSFLLFKNFYFDKPDTYHLSYGSEIDYKTNTENLNKNDYKVFNMSAPIRFTVWTKDKDASVTPSVYIKEK